MVFLFISLSDLSIIVCALGSQRRERENKNTDVDLFDFVVKGVQVILHLLDSFSPSKTENEEIFLATC